VAVAVGSAGGHDPFALDGAPALVTGAAGGIGTAVAEALARAGALVVCADEVRPTSAPAGSEIVVCDLVEPGAAARSVATAVERLGGLRVVVNCVGLLVPNRPAEDVEPAEWERSFAVNATAVFAVCRAAGRAMIAAGSGGAITNVTSLAELAALPHQAAYTASKGALASLTRSLAIDWAPYGIRVNAIAPGPVETAMTAALHADPAVRAQLLRRIPLGRIGRPSDVADAALYLSSPAAGYVTGHTLVVDGGWRAGEPSLAPE
jgi:NAD(P)-dependent dehydrogenase (short-subunit alcohol dehydrogenase family)